MALLLNIAQVLVSAGTFLIPTQSDNYELYSEGSFAVSQFISGIPYKKTFAYTHARGSICAIRTRINVYI